MNVVTVHGYQPIIDQSAPDAQIVITGSFPEENIGVQSGESMKDWERRSTEKFQSEAAAIYDVLSGNLPGGTLHQLLIIMLQGKLNLLVVKETE